ncbi:MAG TPA: hypothetical protein VM580_19470, partial [Labilithrix sp.]|nr:hypothetical protein [Labilithrix sp.]
TQWRSARSVLAAGMASRTKPMIDHEEIRRWAEQRRAKPAIVKGTNIIRLDLPGYSGEESLETISWDEWFKHFEDSNLALLSQESTSRGQKSNFNKLIGRETIDLESGKLVATPRRRAKQARRGAAKKAARPTTTRRPVRAAKGAAKRPAKTKTARPVSKRTSRGTTPTAARGAGRPTTRPTKTKRARGKVTRRSRTGST